MRVAIVGNTGFIGGHLQKRFIHIHELELFNSSFPVLNSGRLNNKLDGIDVVIWAASKNNPRIALESPELVDQELGSWKAFLEALLDAPPKKIIFLSSGGCVYDQGNPPFFENQLAFGTNSYGRLKIEMEDALKESGLNYLIFRVANVYGPKQPVGRGQGVIAEWINSFSSNRPLSIIGSEESRRDYLYIDDLSRAIALGLNIDYSTTLNIGSGTSTSLNELFALFEKLSGKNLEKNHLSGREIDRDAYFLEISKAKEVLNWTPSYSLENGLKVCLDAKNIE